MNFRIANVKPCDITRCQIKLWEIQKAMKETKNNLTWKVAENTRNGVTWDEDRIDENSEGWLEYKIKQGYSLAPMTMKDFDFVNRSFMFLISFKGRTTAEIFLHPRAMDKYLFILYNIENKNYANILPWTYDDNQMYFFVQSMYEELNAVLKPRGIRLQLK